ncbi:MAG: hypothetical protein RMY36_027990 [Nostoc sp. SerVER01]|nr:hypothetical protein [Nostoc sp. SerVER01]
MPATRKDRKEIILDLEGNYATWSSVHLPKFGAAAFAAVASHSLQLWQCLFRLPIYIKYKEKSPQGIYHGIVFPAFVKNTLKLLERLCNLKNPKK